MAELVLEIYEDEGSSLVVPIETAICLSVIESTHSHLNVILVSNNVRNDSYEVRYKSSEFLSCQELNRGSLKSRPLYTALPTIILQDELYFVAGLAAVLRQVFMVLILFC